MKAPQLSPAFLFQLLVLLVLAPVAGMSASELVSAKADGSQGNSWSNDAEASTSGRYVTFASSATDLVPDDTNSALDIFVKDRVTGAIERVSVDSTGTQAIGSSQGETGSRSPSISGDGRYVVFTSGATNLVAGDVNNRTDIFLKDRQTGALTLVSVTAAGARSDSHCREPRISADGRFVVFSSQASTFVPGASTNHNIYLKDLATGAIEQVSVDSNEAQFNGSAYESAVSGDGSRVVFSLENFSDGTFHLYLRDRSAGTSEIISRHSDGTPGNHQSFGARITPDGRHVAFWSDASNLVDSDANSSRDIFVRHLDTATTELASVSRDETQGNDWSYNPAISDDARHVVFLSTATDLVAGDTNGFLDIFVRDLVAGDTARVSVPGGGGEANGHNYHPAISGSGNLVFFDSLATNLLPSDANGASDDVLAVANPFFVAVHRPDNVLSRAGDAGGVGNGVYNATAAGQTLTAVSRRARPVRANLFVGNDGNVEDSCLVRGSRGNRYFGTSYFSGGNRSAQVLAGTYRTPVLAAGESEVLNVVVSPKRKALLRKVRRKGRTVLVWRRVQGRFVLVSRSAAAPALSDAAALVVRHR